jgi:hypothetical protein
MFDILLVVAIAGLFAQMAFVKWAFVIIAVASALKILEVVLKFAFGVGVGVKAAHAAKNLGGTGEVKWSKDPS